MGLFTKEKKEKEPQYIMSPINTPMVNYNVYYMNAKERILYFILLFGCSVMFNSFATLWTMEEFYRRGYMKVL